MTGGNNEMIIYWRGIFITWSYVCFSANNLHTYDGVSSSDIIGADVFFEIIEPEELGYTYRIRPAKDFGAPFVSLQRKVLKHRNNEYYI
jgi:hypothetical protein